MEETSSSLTNIDPYPEEWLTPNRIRYLNEVISPLAPVLNLSGLLDQTLKAWMIYELVNEVSSNLINNKSKLDETVNAWARSRWGHRLETLYLKKKNNLDEVSFRMLTVTNKDLAYELYHRIKAGEATFDELSLHFGVGDERYRGGLFPLQPLASFPENLQSSVKKMEIGDLLKPFAYGKGYAVLVLEQWAPAAFDLKSEKRLLEWELRDWQLSMLPAMKDHLLS